MEIGKLNRRGGGPSPVRVYVEDDCWFVDDDNGRLGPFDRVYEICMSSCFLGGSICETREISGEQMADLLLPLMT